MDKNKLSKKEISDGAKLVEKYKKRYVAVSKATKPILISLVALLGGAAGAGGYFTYKYVTNGGGSSPVTPVEDNKVTVIFEDYNGNLQERRIEKGKSIGDASLIPSNTYNHFGWYTYTYDEERQGYVPEYEFNENTIVNETMIVGEESTISYKINNFNQSVAVGGTTEVIGTVKGKGFDIHDFEIDYTDGTSSYIEIGELVYDEEKSTVSSIITGKATGEVQVGVGIKSDKKSKYKEAQEEELAEWFNVSDVKTSNFVIDDKWTFGDIQFEYSDQIEISNISDSKATVTLKYHNSGEPKEISLKIEDDEENVYSFGATNFQSGSGEITLKISNWDSIVSGKNYSLKGIEIVSAFIDYSKAVDDLKEKGITLNSTKSTAKINSADNEIDLRYSYDGEETITLTLGLYNDKDELIEKFDEINFYNDEHSTSIYFENFDKVSNGQKLYLKQAPESQKWTINYDNSGLEAKNISLYAYYCTQKITESSSIITLYYDGSSLTTETDLKLGLYSSSESTVAIQEFNVHFVDEDDQEVSLDPFTHFTDPEVLELDTLYLKVIEE